MADHRAVQDPRAQYALDAAAGGDPAGREIARGPPPPSVPPYATGHQLEDYRAPGRVKYWHKFLLDNDQSHQIAWERSSSQWGGLGPRVAVELQWSAHDAMWRSDS